MMNRVEFAKAFLNILIKSKITVEKIIKADAASSASIDTDAPKALKRLKDQIDKFITNIEAVDLKQKARYFGKGVFCANLVVIKDPIYMTLTRVVKDACTASKDSDDWLDAEDTAAIDELRGKCE